jgi:hypothetical protein
VQFDDYILEAVRGTTRERPQDLIGILYHVDGRMKLVMSQDELSGGLQRLIEQGSIAESERHKFYEVTDGVAPRTFSGLTLDEHRRACEAYQKWFWKKHRELTKK